MVQDRNRIYYESAVVSTNRLQLDQIINLIMSVLWATPFPSFTLILKSAHGLKTEENFIQGFIRGNGGI